MDKKFRDKRLSLSDLFKNHKQRLQNTSQTFDFRTGRFTRKQSLVDFQVGYFQDLLNLNTNFTKLEDDLDLWLDQYLASNKIDRNLFCWNKWIPQSNFGLTGSKLTNNELIHFLAIETILRSRLIKDPSDWMLFKMLNMTNRTSGGVILKVGPPEIPQMFVVKSPFKNNDKTLMHEYFIGKMVSNDMRRKGVPNFPYFFGIINCSNAFVYPHNPQARNAGLVSWCEKNTSFQNSVPQIIMQNIQNAKSLGSVVSEYKKLFKDLNNAKSGSTPDLNVISHITTSLNQLLNIIKITMGQIFNAVELAFLEHRFSHNDLHYGNVLIVHLPNSLNEKDWYVPFAQKEQPFIQNSKVIVIKNYLAILIDFGQSSFEGSEKKIGDQDSVFFTLPSSVLVSRFNKSRPINDFIHLIIWVAKSIKEKYRMNNPLWNLMNSLYESVINVLTTRELNFPSMSNYITINNTKEKWLNLDQNSLDQETPITSMAVLKILLKQLDMKPIDLKQPYVSSNSLSQEQIETTLKDWLQPQRLFVENNDLPLIQEIRLLKAINNQLPSLGSMSDQEVASFAKWFLDVSHNAYSKNLISNFDELEQLYRERFKSIPDLANLFFLLKPAKHQSISTSFLKTTSSPAIILKN